jgi:hypothetical protein
MRLIVRGGVSLVPKLLPKLLRGSLFAKLSVQQKQEINSRSLPSESSDSVQNDQSIEGITPLHFDRCRVGAKNHRRRQSGRY